MRKIILATAATALGAAIATPALAQDVANAPFTGPRVEVLAGYDNLQDGGDGDSDGRSGFLYGGGIGYDVQVGGAVIGAEGEITDSTTKARSTGNFVTGDSLRLDAGRDLYVGGRVGYAISPLAMVYAKAGYTNARISTRYIDGATTSYYRADLDGYRLGAGLEYNITPTAYVKGEYRYSHYGNLEGVDIDLDRHQLLAGVGIRF